MSSKIDPADDHAPSLAAILDLVPEHGILSIDVGPGWYPLLARIVDELIASGYDFRILQVKEKFGGLRFYWTLPSPEPGCCSEFRRADPHPLGFAPGGLLFPGARTEPEREQLRAWEERDRAHRGSPEHEAAVAALAASPKAAALDQTRTRLRAFVHAIEAESFTVCESCGSHGMLHERTGRMRTLCEVCAVASGFELRVRPTAAGAGGHPQDEPGDVGC